MAATADTVAVGAPVPSLVRWGLSPDADLIYRTLVTYGSASAPELARALGVPSRRVAAALEELRARDAVRQRPDRRGGAAVWAGRPPADVLPEQRRRRLRIGPPRPHDHPSALPPELRWLPLGDGLRHLPTRQAARARLAQIVSAARHEHLSMNTERSYDPESTRSAAPMDRLLLDRGVRMRVLGLHSLDDDPMRPHRPRSGEPEPDYRQATAVPMKLMVVDRRIALFPATPDNLENGYLEVSREPVVSALTALFERHWQATPPTEPVPPGVVLSPRERALIGLLARGFTDAAAARHLRISTRSVTAAMRGLMDRLDVENRFQLGLALGAARVAAAPPGQVARDAPPQDPP